MDEFNAFMRTTLLAMISAKDAEVSCRLEYCRNAMSLKPECENAEKFEKDANQICTSIIPNKVNDLYSWMIDLMIRQYSEVFRTMPTPVPDLKDSTKSEVVDSIMEVISNITTARVQQVIPQIISEYAAVNVSITPEQAIDVAQRRGLQVYPNDEEIEKIVESMRGASDRYEYEVALLGAQRLQDRVNDILTETKSFDEIRKFLFDFCQYPYAVLSTVNYKKTNIREWNGENLAIKRKVLPYLRRVAPEDFYWSSDSTNTQDGFGVAERLAYRLYELQEMKSFDWSYTEQIDKIINKYEGISRDWVSPVISEGLSLPLMTSTKKIQSWSTVPNDTIDVFIMFVKLPRYVLDNYDVSVDEKLGDVRDVEVEAWVCDGVIIGMRFHHPDNERPYAKESYEEVNNYFCGKALPEILRMTAMMSRKTFIHTIRNLGRSISPSVIMDMTVFDPDDFDDEPEIEPDTSYGIYPKIGQNRKAFDVVSMPNYTQILMAFSNFIDERADKESGVPRYALGQAANLPSALRSADALSQMINSALKTVTSKIFRIGTMVIAPSATVVARWVMKNDKLDVDAEIKMQGLEGIIHKGVVNQQIRELLQYLYPFRQSGDVSPEVVRSLINKYLLNSGMSRIDAESMVKNFISEAQPQAQQEPQQERQPEEVA